MMMLILLVALWTTLTTARGTSIGQFLHRVMVEIPAAAMNATTRGHMLLAALVFGITCMVAWFGEADGLRMLGMAVPDAAAWATTFEVSAYLDVIAALVATSAVMRIRAVSIQLLAAITPLFRRSVGKPRPRSNRQSGHPKSANDDEDGALALAS
jgi:hypothetical protein